MGKSNKAEFVPVSMRALIQRINRTLAKNGEQLRAARGERARAEVGAYYIINVDRNILVWKRVDPETWGRKLGVLKEWEAVC